MPRAIDKDGNEYRLPSYREIWERNEAVDIRFDREDLRFIISNLRHSQERNEKMLEVLRKAKTDSVTPEDRMILQENMRHFTNEQLVEQIDGWISYIETFKHYADTLDRIRGTGSEPSNDEGPDSYDWNDNNRYISIEDVTKK